MKKLTRIYWALTILVLADVSLYVTAQVSLPGHWLDWALFWCWFILTFIVTLMHIKERWAFWYSVTLVVLTTLSLFPMGIPFLSVVAFAISPVDHSVRLDSRVILRETSRSVIAIPTVEAVKSYYIFERTIGNTDFNFSVNDKSYRLIDVESVRTISNDNADGLTIEFRFKDGIVTRSM
jgi:hypothetical protein